GAWAYHHAQSRARPGWVDPLFVRTRNGLNLRCRTRSGGARARRGGSRMIDAAVKPNADIEDGPAARPVARPRAATNAWRISVLLVDDDAADANLVLDILQHHPKVGAADAFAEPDKALAELSSGRRRPDLIFLDINMPKVDGFTFAEELERIPHMRGTPVV